MNQVQEGLFAVTEQMPCSPNDIWIGYYALPETLDRMEREEAAARILSFSLQLNQWVGVSLRSVFEEMQKDYAAHQEAEEVRSHNFAELRRVEEELREYNFRCRWSLGVYAWFAAEPTARLREAPNAPVPFSGIFMSGPQHIITGVRELIELNLLRHVQMDEGASDILFPTPALISRIMLKQAEAAT